MVHVHTLYHKFIWAKISVSIKTSGLRLSVQLFLKKSAGVHNFIVNKKWFRNRSFPPGSRFHRYWSDHPPENVDHNMLCCNTTFSMERTRQNDLTPTYITQMSPYLHRCHYRIKIHSYLLPVVWRKHVTCHLYFSYKDGSRISFPFEPVEYPKRPQQLPGFQLVDHFVNGSPMINVLEDLCVCVCVVVVDIIIKATCVRWQILELRVPMLDWVDTWDRSLYDTCASAVMSNVSPIEQNLWRTPMTWTLPIQRSLS